MTMPMTMPLRKYFILLFILKFYLLFNIKLLSQELTQEVIVENTIDIVDNIDNIDTNIANLNIVKKIVKKSSDDIVSPELKRSEWKEVILEIEELKTKDSIKTTIISVQNKTIETLQKKIDINEMILDQYKLIYNDSKEINNDLVKELEKKEKNFLSDITDIIDDTRTFIFGFGVGVLVSIIFL